MAVGNTPCGRAQGHMAALWITSASMAHCGSHNAQRKNPQGPLYNSPLTHAARLRRFRCGLLVLGVLGAVVNFCFMLPHRQGQGSQVCWLSLSCRVSLNMPWLVIINVAHSSLVYWTSVPFHVFILFYPGYSNHSEASPLLVMRRALGKYYLSTSCTTHGILQLQCFDLCVQQHVIACCF